MMNKLPVNFPLGAESGFGVNLLSNLNAYFGFTYEKVSRHFPFDAKLFCLVFLSQPKYWTGCLLLFMF